MPKMSEEDGLWFRLTRPPVAAAAGVVALMFLAAIAAMLMIPVLVGFGKAHGRDLGQWQDSPVKEWYQTLMQPDNPGISCCGEADAYWCDDISVKDGKTFCALTDDREIKGRPSLPMGMKVEIPDRKLKWEQEGKPIGNPTGHSVVFLSSGGAVYCFVQNSGI